MGNIQSYSVSIVLEGEADLIRRIQASAEARGISFQATLEEAVNIGLWPHITRNLNMLDRIMEQYGDDQS